MRIDIVSDVVCPWCFIGKRRFESALAGMEGFSPDIRWRAYRLDPTIPPGGVDRRAYLARKFGTGERPKTMAEAIRAAGAEAGIGFAFDRIARTPNTLDAHRVIRWAGTAGVQGAVVERLFRAYFEEGLDLGDAAELARLGDEAGMDAALVAALLASDADVALIEREDHLARRLGIQGVPTFIFADRYMVSGALDPAQFTEILTKMRAEYDAARQAAGA